MLIWFHEGGRSFREIFRTLRFHPRWPMSRLGTDMRGEFSGSGAVLAALPRLAWKHGTRIRAHSAFVLVQPLKISDTTPNRVIPTPRAKTIQSPLMKPVSRVASSGSLGL